MQNVCDFYFQTKVCTHPHTRTKTEKLDSLVPGEETEVQVAVKCGPDLNAGHWSSWSQPVRAIVPQSAGVFKQERMDE